MQCQCVAVSGISALRREDVGLSLVWEFFCLDAGLREPQRGGESILPSLVTEEGKIAEPPTTSQKRPHV